MTSTTNNQTDESQNPIGKGFWIVASLVLGLVGGVFLHYLFYRLSLPIEPFIYVSF